MTQFILFAAAIAATFLPAANAHGYLSSPASRNYIARTSNEDYCPHCLNGGTVGTVSANSIDGLWPYPETVGTSVRHGLCGDPAPASGATQAFMAGGQFARDTIAGTYDVGQIIEAEFSITTHHRGHVEFSLCDVGSLDDPNGSITQECLNTHKLNVVDDLNEPSFVDPAYPNRYFLPPKCAGSSTNELDPFYQDAYVYKALLQLPQGLSCEHCVLQWYYVTDNTCNPPGYRQTPWPNTFSDCDGDGPGLGWWATGLDDCIDETDPSNGRYPEEFWNCADIRIGSSTPTPPTPNNPTPTPTPNTPTPNNPTPNNPTPRPTTTTVSGDCLPHWSTCAGGGMAESCCQGDLQCFEQSQYYSQCLTSCPAGWACDTQPSNPTPAPTTPTNPTPSPTSDPAPTNPTPAPTDGSQGDCLSQWSTCAGSGVTGSYCCQEGLQCFEQSQYYSQCLPSCPAGWACDTQPSNPTPQTSQPTPAPTAPTEPTPNPTSTPGSNPPPPSGTSPWDTTTTSIMYHGKRVQLQGVAVTCMEYMLRGIGGECLAEYNWSDPSNIITTVSRTQVDAIIALLTQSHSDNVVPTARLSLNAAYYLDAETPMWSQNRAQYPDLAGQYRTLLDNLINEFTNAGIVTVLDLHWNDDVTEQQEMALKDIDGTTGDSVQFWDALAAKYGSNHLVWYELYNEPHASSYSTWLMGGGRFEGMWNMYNAIRAHTEHPIIVAGQENYAYDAEALVSFEATVQPTGVVYNLHPYMGPYQQYDESKNIGGYEERVARVLDGTGRPLIITEFGQYCCPANGACYLYDGTYDGSPMGFVEAVLTVNLKYDVSWTAWAWRPQQPGALGDCNQPDANAGIGLYGSNQNQGQGADWGVLFPQFYGVVTSA